MNHWPNLKSMAMILVIILLAVGCSRKTATPVGSALTDTPDSITQTKPALMTDEPGGTAPVSFTLTPTSEAPGEGYPQPGQSQATPTPPVYPGPEGVSSTATFAPYPGPEVVNPTAPVGAYPGPATVAPTITSAGYPPPGASASQATATGGAFPLPAGGSPTLAQSNLTPTATPTSLARLTPSSTLRITPGTPGTPTLTPTITPTPTLVRTRIVASDPSTFQIASGGYQLVEFFATWSPVSQSMAPMMHNLEGKHSDRIRFVYLDLDDPANNLYARMLQDRLPPHFYLLDGQGSVVNEWHGYTQQAEFTRALEGIAP